MKIKNKILTILAPVATLTTIAPIALVGCSNGEIKATVTATHGSAVCSKIKLNNSFTITFTPETGYVLATIDIRIGNKTLQLTSDYTVSGNVITVKAEAVTSSEITINLTGALPQISVHCNDKAGKIEFTAPTSIEEGKDLVITALCPVHWYVDIETSEITVNEKTLKYDYEDPTKSEFSINWDTHQITIKADVIKAKGGNKIECLLNSVESTSNTVTVHENAQKITSMDPLYFTVYAGWAEEINIPFETYSKYVNEESIKVEAKNCTVKLAFDEVTTETGKGTMTVSWTAEQAYNHCHSLKEEEWIGITISDVVFKNTLKPAAVAESGYSFPEGTEIDVEQGQAVVKTISFVPPTGKSYSTITAQPVNPDLADVIELTCSKDAEGNWSMKVVIEEENANWIAGLADEMTLTINFQGK